MKRTGNKGKENLEVRDEWSPLFRETVATGVDCQVSVVVRQRPQNSLYLDHFAGIPGLDRGFDDDLSLQRVFSLAVNL